jgi:uncharacterized cupin superfamily protein
MGLTRLEEAPAQEFDLGHLRGRWTDLGRAAGSRRLGLRRIEIPAGAWSTPAHEHGREEEIFYVVSGRGLSWQAGRTAEVGAGDCIVHLARGGEHTLHATESLDVLAFGTREDDEGPAFPRLGLSRLSGRAFETVPGSVDGAPIQWQREAELGPPELPAPGERPSTIVNVSGVKPRVIDQPRVARTAHDLGRTAGSVRAGLQYVEVPAGMPATPLHCHSMEEELFVILDGDGTLVLGAEESPLERGHVVSRPAATRVAHQFRAGVRGLTYLAYGTREPGDMCYYPRSRKVAFRGLGVIARVEPLDYWDGED